MSHPKPNRPSDARIVVRCQLGSQDAWRELVQLWNPRLVAFFSRMVNDSANVDDLLQTTWLQIVRTMTRLENVDRFSPWAYRIARNTLNDQLRKQYRRPTMVPTETNVEPSELDFDLERWIETDQIAAALRTLDHDERLVVTLHYFEHLSVAETAEVCQSPIGTIKSRLQRARRLLRQQLQTEPNE